jgi:hypothetical protein
MGRGHRGSPALRRRDAVLMILLLMAFPDLALGLPRLVMG